MASDPSVACPLWLAYKHLMVAQKFLTHTTKPLAATTKDDVDDYLAQNQPEDVEHVSA